MGCMASSVDQEEEEEEEEVENKAAVVVIGGMRDGRADDMPETRVRSGLRLNGPSDA
jgi:hypothetical protein